MSELLYDIIFCGDIVLGHQLADVKVRLQELFKTDSAKIDALFSGRPIPLKRGLGLIDAQKYRDALVKSGAQVELVASVNSGAIAAEAKPSITSAPATSSHSPERQSIPKNQGGNWSLAPVGAELLTGAEKPVDAPARINTSAFSLRPGGGNLLDISEQKTIAPSSIIVPDFKLAEVGADLVRAEEKISLSIPDVNVNVNVSDWNIAELGADMIGADEKEISVPLVIQNLNASLAPAGADLGQLKLLVKPIVPNISSLKLVD